MFLTEQVLAARRRLSDGLELCPRAYIGVMRMRYRNTPNFNRIVSPQTDLIIEGFPRCANSFAVRAFRMANDAEATTRIATHFHSPANILPGLRWRIPALVLTRHPDDAVVSFPALAIQLNKHGFARASEAVLLRQIRYWTRRYIQFYQRLQPVRDELAVADFTETTSDFGAVIQRVNTRFGTNFRPFEHSAGNVDQVMTRHGPHLAPSAERDAIKQRLQKLYHADHNNSLRAEAVAAHQRFLAGRVPPGEVVAP